MDILNEIKKNKQAVLDRRQVPHGGPCGRCRKVFDRFILHGFRTRVFLVVVQTLVRRAETELARWRCPDCNGTFTDYPAFAIPGKRYVKADILERSRRYLDKADATYRAVIKSGNRSTVYEDCKGLDDGRALSQTSLWRWVGFWGRLEETLRRLLGLIMEADPVSLVHRSVRMIAPHKCRSDMRRKILQKAARLVEAAESFPKILRPINFTDYGTGNPVS